jgi:hypothetical protein
LPVTKKPHLTPLVRASRGAFGLRMTGSFRPRGWKGRAFIPLKNGVAERESSKQAEALVADLLTILGISESARRELVPRDWSLHSQVVRTSISARYG